MNFYQIIIYIIMTLGDLRIGKRNLKYLTSALLKLAKSYTMLYQII